jgi:amicyanin
VKRDCRPGRAMWMWRSAIIGTTALGGLALAGWVSAGQPVRAEVFDKSELREVATAPAPPGPKIQIAKHKYDHPTLTVPVGTTVTWLNKDEDVHTVVSTTQAFRSPGLETDDAYSYKFTKPGEYQYFCTLHPLMTGKVIVK